MADDQIAIRGAHHAIQSLSSRDISRSRYSKLIEQSKRTPRTPAARLQASLCDEVVDVAQLRNDGQEEKTYFYLAYGSNLCALTFLDRRGIRPISQFNVVVPAIQLSFDLSGIAYAEPCFGNVRYRDHSEDRVQEKQRSHDADYHKDRWKKGLVGVVYEVTASDFAHIIETEGGGVAYHDVLVDCYTLSPDPNEEVPLNPTSMQCKAHTLFSPGRLPRSDPSYAQPSARYLKLITDGAEEHNLPYEYRAYLAQIRPYTVTTTAQELGKWIFLLTWGPLVAFVALGGGKLFTQPDGRYPDWYAKLSTALFTGVWASYDHFFKPLFGDGERTITDGGSAPHKGESHEPGVDSGEPGNEKTPLLPKASSKDKWCEPGTRGAEEMV